MVYSNFEHIFLATLYKVLPRMEVYLVAWRTGTPTLLRSDFGSVFGRHLVQEATQRLPDVALLGRGTEQLASARAIAHSLYR
jgi:hypothetical protein